MSLFPSPLVAALGAGGLIPFCALSKPGAAQLDVDNRLGPLRRLLGRPSLNATELQVTYGCMILSFLGAPHWGFALGASPPASPRANAFRLVWGVTPSLLAWPCASTPAPLSLDALSAGLAAAMAVDLQCWRAALVPRSYLSLRVPLTVVAVASLQSSHARFNKAP
mgnify:CR=1 FL=1